MSRVRTRLPLALLGAVALAAALMFALGRSGPEPAAAATSSQTGAAVKAAKKPERGAFQQALAAKLAGRLGKPLDDVTNALKEANKANAPARPEGDTRKERRANARKARADRLEARAKALRDGDRKGKGARGEAAAKAHARFDAWAGDVAKALDLTAGEVKGAIRAMVDDRLRALVAENWLTDDQYTARLACFDDAANCTSATRGSNGLALLRAGVR